MFVVVIRRDVLFNFIALTGSGIQFFIIQKIYTTRGFCFTNMLLLEYVFRFWHIWLQQSKHVSQDQCKYLWNIKTECCANFFNNIMFHQEASVETMKMRNFSSPGNTKFIANRKTPSCNNKLQLIIRVLWKYSIACKGKCGRFWHFCETVALSSNSML